MNENQNNRFYPRIETEWPIYKIQGRDELAIGFVKNISLSGILLHVFADHLTNSDRTTFSLRVSNPLILPKPILLNGLKKWSRIENDEILVAFQLEHLDAQSRSYLIQCLSCCEKLRVEVYLYDAG